VPNQTDWTEDAKLSPAHQWMQADAPIEHVSVASLVRGDSPRLKGESKAHTASLAEAVEVPPIIVHRPTMQIIDGLHRWDAAQLRHQDTIAVRFFDGTADEAFVLAVAANVTHGRPLSRPDRKAAEARILGMYPEWSDRMIAVTAGLSHPTVAAIRRRWPTGKTFQLATRLGRDGKARPLSFHDGRQAAADLIHADQNMSEREIAKQAHVSRGTVHDVQARLNHGVDPCARTTRAAGLNFHLARGQAVLTRLRKNPSVRFHQDGRALLEVLSRSLQIANDAQAASRAAPEHCRDAVAELAAAVSDAWSRIAQDLRTRNKTG